LQNSSFRVVLGLAISLNLEVDQLVYENIHPSWWLGRKHLYER